MSIHTLPRNIDVRDTHFIVMILSPWDLLCFSTSICAPVTTRIVFILLPPLPITLLIAFGGTDTFLERNGEFINLPESSDCPLWIINIEHAYNHIIIRRIFDFISEKNTKKRPYRKYYFMYTFDNVYLIKCISKCISYFRTTSFHPSSRFPPCFGLVVLVVFADVFNESPSYWLL